MRWTLAGEETNGNPKHLPHWDKQRFTVQMQDNITSRQLDAKYAKSVLQQGSHVWIQPCWGCGHKADFVCLWAGSLYLQPEGRSLDSPCRGWSQQSNMASWTEWGKAGVFRSITVLCRGIYLVAEISPNSLLKSHLITGHLYRSCCMEFLPVFLKFVHFGLHADNKHRPEKKGLESMWQITHSVIHARPCEQ